MAVQIAVKLPDEFVAALDRLVSEGAFDSRSSAVRRGVAVLLAVHRRQAIDQAYVEGYARVPETDEEIQEATRMAVASINGSPRGYATSRVSFVSGPKRVPHPCVAAFDNLRSFPKAMLVRRLGGLAPSRAADICAAARATLDC